MRTGFLLALIMLVAAVVFFGCDGEPECPDCPECPECAEGYHLECVPDEEPKPPPPPPPPGPDPSEYITRTRAGALGEKCVTSTGLLAELCFDEQSLIWDGIRNPEYAVAHCCAALPGPWPYECVELQAVIELNGEVYNKLLGFMVRLQQVNKRCDPSHPEHRLEFCGRTDVRRGALSEFRAELLDPALEVAAGLNGIRAWCEGQ